MVDSNCYQAVNMCILKLVTKWIGFQFQNQMVSVDIHNWSCVEVINKLLIPCCLSLPIINVVGRNRA